MTKLLTDYVEKEYKNESYRATIHDLRNISRNFNYMIDEYKREKKGTIFSDTEESLVSLYELLNFRIDILSGTVSLTREIAKEQKIHPLVLKLTHILKYRSDQKEVKFVISDQHNSFKITKALYLSLFIVLENAVKYSIPDSNIDVTFNEDNQQTIICISNICEKIDEDANYLIKNGNRGSNALKKGTLGNGIGLSLVDELLKQTHAEMKIRITDINNELSKFRVNIILHNPVTCE